MHDRDGNPCIRRRLVVVEQYFRISRIVVEGREVRIALVAGVQAAAAGHETPPRVARARHGDAVDRKGVRREILKRLESFIARIELDGFRVDSRPVGPLFCPLPLARPHQSQTSDKIGRHGVQRAAPVAPELRDLPERGGRL